MAAAARRQKGDFFALCQEFTAYFLTIARKQGKGERKAHKACKRPDKGRSPMDERPL